MSQFLFYANCFFSIVVFALFLSKRSKNKVETSSIFPFVTLIFLSCIYEFVGTELFSIPSAVFFKVYTFLEVFVLIYYFDKLFGRPGKQEYAIFGALFMVLFAYVLKVCIEQEWDFRVCFITDAYLSAFETMLVYFFSIRWFMEVFKDLPQTSLLRLPHFYFISGLIMYVSGPLFLFLLSGEIIRNNPDELTDYWLINGFFNLVLRFFLIIGIWKITK